MKTQIATDREQSTRLLACGVKPETADMCIRIEIPKNQEPKIKLQIDGLVGYEHTDPKKTVKIIPAWSLSRLLALLPHSILAENEDEEYYDYELFIYPVANGKMWEIDYAYTEDFVCESVFECSDISLIEACVRAIIWLLSNGYSLNNIEQ